jgi:hypothetical protein
MFNIHVYHHFPGEAVPPSRFEVLLNLILKGVDKMALDMTVVNAATNRIESLVQNVGVELAELKAAFDNAMNAGDQAALQVIGQRLGVAADALAAFATAADITPETPVEP